MRSFRFIFAFLLLSIAAVAQNNPPPAIPAPAASLEKLAWLAGRWRLERAGRVTDEYWMAPAGGVMLGMARTVSKGKELEHEFLQIRQGPGGELFYIAQPSGQPEAAFKLLSFTDTEVVFENKVHDFPQMIGYTLKHDGSVTAWIEGPGKDGNPKRIEFPYKRMP